jgi:hypothetical protein
MDDSSRESSSLSGRFQSDALPTELLHVRVVETGLEPVTFGPLAFACGLSAVESFICANGQIRTDTVLGLRQPTPTCWSTFASSKVIQSFSKLLVPPRGIAPPRPQGTLTPQASASAIPPRWHGQGGRTRTGNDAHPKRVHYHCATP